MRQPRTRPLAAISVVILAVILAVSGVVKAQTPAPKADWTLNATLIEACSCSMFCPCYFTTKPAPDHAGHGAGGEHYCRFNIAYKINKGMYGTTDLAGAKVWIAGDLGDDFGDNETEWAEVTFDPSVTKEQRDGIAAILVGPVYPWKWKSFTVGADAPIEWSGDKTHATAKLDAGKAGEIQLAHNPTAENGEPTVITNLKYFHAPHNQGFILMPNKVEAYRRGDKKFEYNNTNGFMITLDINSKEVM